MAYDVFILGLDDFHLRQLQQLRSADAYRFHELYRKQDVKSDAQDVAERVLAGARDRLARFPGRVDAVVGYWDFPVSTMLPLLRRDLGLPTPSFEALLKCEHKFWSRLEQARSIPGHIPAFCAVDPFDDASVNAIALEFPFWIKPVKSVLSYLGFKVESARQLEQAIASIRAGIARIAVPFNHLLQFAELPAEVAQVDGRHCIAEALISRGRQCTLEGYVQGGEVNIYGAIDSVREGIHASCFSRYAYPSTLPRPVLDRMGAITRRFLTHIGFDASPFNVEFYWDERSDHISLLEVNPRISKSHALLFKLVDGEFHHQVMLDVALGMRPDFPVRQGRFAVAAKFMWRAFEDACVSEVPDARRLQEICRQFPGTGIELHVSEGARLSTLAYQDSYSYELAAIFVGADDEEELMQKYAAIQRAIGIRLTPP